MKQITHLKINENLSGKIIELKDGYSKVVLETTIDMRADNSGLIHGGFIFSMADYAAMVAVNHPNVVLGGANVKFLKPVVEGDIITAEARVIQTEGKKQIVKVEIKNNKDVIIFSGEFICFALEQHVLKR